MSEYDIYVSTIFIKTKLDLSNCTPEGGGEWWLESSKEIKKGKVIERKKERKIKKELC